MPVLDGFAATLEIRELDQLARTAAWSGRAQHAGAAARGVDPASIRA